MRRISAFVFLLVLISLFVFFSRESLATTSGPSAGSFRCDRQSGARDCYFSVPSPGSDFQGYRVNVQSLVDGIFTDDNSSVVIEVCIAQTNSFPGANPLACWTPISNWAQPPPIRVFTHDKSVSMGNPENPGNWANFHIRINNAFSETRGLVWGRRVSVEEFKADKTTISPGGSTTLRWVVGWAQTITVDGTTYGGNSDIEFTTGSKIVSPSTTTTYNISAYGPGGFEGAINVPGPSVTITVTSPPPPPVPTPTPGPFTLNPTSCQGSGFYNLTWTNSSNASTYNVYRRAWSTGAGNPWIQIASGVTGTSYTTQEALGTDWYFYVEAVNQYGKTNSTPGPPDGLSGGSCPSTSQPPTCAASPATVKKNDTTTISADGGNGTYSWSGGGSPATETGSTFVTSWSTEGTKTVTVTSGGNSGFCTVEVTKSQPTEPLPPTCSASPTTVYTNQNVNFTGGSGDGVNYSWFDGATSLGIGQTMTNSWSTAGTKNVTVSSGGKSGTCPAITVNPETGPGTTDVIGFLDRPSTQSDCDLIGGWALDKGHKSEEINVKLLDSVSGWTTIVPTDVYRPDVNSDPNVQATGNHGFNISTPTLLKNGYIHTIYAYGIDKDTGAQVDLTNSPRSLKCGTPPVTNITGTITCNNQGGTCNLSPGQAATIHWEAAGATNCNILPYYPTPGWSGISGTMTDPAPATRRVDLDCWNANPNSEAVVASVQINVSSPQQSGPTSATSSCTVFVQAPPPTPAPTPAPNSPSGVSVAEPNYCLSGPAATVNWVYSDPAGSPQSAYQVQIDDQGSFNSPEWDSGKISCSGCRSNSTPQGILQFNTTYRARVRVWNQNDIASDWNVSSSWKTPAHAFPQVNFIFSPNQPASNVAVQFTDQTQFFDGNPNGRRRSWLFGDGGSSTQQNPVKSYANEGNYNVTLSATDNANQSCSISKPINIRILNPIWKEVNPGG